MKKLMILHFLLSFKYATAQQVISKNLSTELKDEVCVLINEITIFNYSDEFTCVPISNSFYSRGLIDTIELAPNGNIKSGKLYFTLEVSTEDRETNFYSTTYYPLIIAPKAVTVLKVKFSYPKTLKECELELQYTNQKNIDYCELIEIYKRDKRKWMKELKFQSKRITL